MKPAGKHALRKRLKAGRRCLPASDVRTLSLAIVKRVSERINWQAVNSLHVYQPINGEGEVDSWILLSEIWRRYPQIRTATWAGSQAVWIRPDGPQEPAVPGHRYDVIIVPTLGFNPVCHRIGFGGGFYDRFLAAQITASKIGLAYDFGCVDFEPEAHDVSLDVIATERHWMVKTK